jgi:hypothetical protein
MPFQKRPDQRRRTFLSLTADIDNGLRDAYGTRFEQGRANQTSLAKKIGVNRSVVHRRLTGLKNLTTHSIADLVWGLDWGIKVVFFDPETEQGRNIALDLVAKPPPSRDQTPPSPKPISTEATPPSFSIFYDMAVANRSTLQ